MITLFTSIDVHHYCGLDSVGRQNCLTEYCAGDERPAGVLSAYELCYAFFELHVSLGSRIARQAFGNCWSEFIDIHNNLGWNGPLIWLESFEASEDRGIQQIYATLELIEVPLHSDRQLNHFPLTWRLRALCEQICVTPLRMLSLEERRWRTPDLPFLSQVQEQADELGMVIDNNNLLQLLNQLDPTGQQGINIESYGALNWLAAQRCQELLTSNSGAKITVPLVVLEEFHRVARTSGEFEQAIDVMKAIIEDRVLYAAVFEFEPLSLEIVAAFIEVRMAVVDLALADAVIVAHAVHHRCPLATGDKRVLAATVAFPFLALG